MNVNILVLLQQNQILIQFVYGNYIGVEIVKKTLKPDSDEFRFVNKWGETGDVNLLAKSLYNHP
jgi:hypothetical protein